MLILDRQAQPAIVILRSLFILAAFACPAAAQDLFRTPGKPTLVSRDIAISGGGYVGQDADGWVYYRNGTACFHADDPTTEHYLPEVIFSEAIGLGESIFAAMLPDGSGVEVAYTLRYPAWMTQGKEALRVYRFSCADLASGTAPTRVGGEMMQADHALFARGLASASFIRTEDGLCFVDNPPPTQSGAPAPGERARVVCVDVDVDPPRVSQLFDGADLDAVLAIDPAWAWIALDGTRATDRDWQLSGLARGPGGRSFFLAYRNYALAAQVTTYMWVVERRADGVFVPRAGPLPASAQEMGVAPLAGASMFVYSAELDAMMLWPVLGQEHHWGLFDGGAVYGWTGVGFQVFPVDAPGSGYLPMSRAYLQHNGCDQLPYCHSSPLGQTEAVVTADGIDIVVRVANATTTIPQFEIFKLSLDPTTLDLDHDGLDATAEAAAGTSDTLPDSDFGGTPDAIEVAMTNTDPRDASAEPALRNSVKDLVRYVPSSLFQKHFAGDAGVRSLAIDGPLCGSGTCYLPEGDVARYPAERARPGTFPVVARDGRSIMLESDAGLERFHFDDGREELAIARADFENVVPCGHYALRVFPIDATRTWIACEGLIDAGGPGEVEARRPARIAYADGGPPVVVYDHQKAQRDSGLTPADDDEFSALDAGVMASITAIGWIEETGRFELAVRGNWDTYLLALTPDGTTTLIGRGRGLKGMNTLDAEHIITDLFPPNFPTSLVPTGHGDYFADGGIMTPYNAFLPGYASWDGRRTVVGGWGDVLTDGGSELVRYERDVLPGDVLIMRGGLNGQAGAMLFKSGPRGGIVELWGPDKAIENVAGMDLARDGSMRLCVADDFYEVVWEFAPAGPEGPPELVRWVADVPFVLDCAYDDDGSLRVLTADHVAVRSGGDGAGFGELVNVEDLSGEPIELVRDASGANVVRSVDGLRGKVYLPDGRAVTMSDDTFTLAVDGSDVIPIANLIYQTTSIPRDPKHPTRIEMAVRADGSIVVAPRDAAPLLPYASVGNILLVDLTGWKQPDGSTAPTYTFLGNHEYIAQYGVGLAVVPGGSAADPWTGRLPERDEPASAPSIDGLTTPSGDVAPKQDGCAGGALAPLIGLVLLACAVFANDSRRRTTRPRQPACPPRGLK